jgi:hypothetical protein
MNTTTQTPETINAAALLYSFAHRRPGLDPRDYGGGRDGWLSYRRESAEISRDLNDFRELYALAWDILGDKLPELIATYLANNSGRLTLKGNALEYIAGQYFPTEYRPAASRCLVSLIWRKFAEQYETGDQIRKAIRRRVSRRVANNYFR